MTTAKRCLMCFALRSTDLYPGTEVPLCRGCKFQSDKLIGFWETQGYGMQLTWLGDPEPNINHGSDFDTSTGEGEGKPPSPPTGSTEEAPSVEKDPEGRKPKSNHR